MDWKEIWETYNWVIVGILYMLNKIRVAIKDKWKNRSQADESNKTDEKIDPIVDTLQKRYRAMRAHIFQFHDGTKAYSGQSLQRKTMTHEAVADGVKRLKHDFDNVLISDSMHRILKILRIEGEYFVRDTEEVKTIDPDFYGFLKRNKIQSLYYLRIRDLKDNTTIATLNLHFFLKDGIMDEDSRIDIRGMRRDIENIFDKI